MIYNLCDNAIRYNKDNGSVTLKVEKHPDDITVTVADTGNWYSLWRTRKSI